VGVRGRDDDLVLKRGDLAEEMRLLTVRKRLNTRDKLNQYYFELYKPETWEVGMIKFFNLAENSGAVDHLQRTQCRGSEAGSYVRLIDLCIT